MSELAASWSGSCDKKISSMVCTARVSAKGFPENCTGVQLQSIRAVHLLL